MNFIEKLEQNKRDITRMKQEAYQLGFTEGEKRSALEFLKDLEEFELKRYSDMIRTLKKIREKWEERQKE